MEGHKCPAQDKNNLYFIVGCTSKYYIVIHRNTIYIYIISQIAFLVIVDRFSGYDEPFSSLATSIFGWPSFVKVHDC